MQLYGKRKVRYRNIIPNEEAAMSAVAEAAVGEIASLRHFARLSDRVLRVNVDGVTHAESLIQPQPAGNCLNFVVGHLVAVYNNALPLVGQELVMERAALERYQRGAPPLTDPAEAMDLGELMAAWATAAERMDAGLAGLAPEVLDQPAPFSPSGDPNETVRSLVATVLFHQAYHAGQTGVLRRVTGHEGAIK
jgi:hypothetical protein